MVLCICYVVDLGFVCVKCYSLCNKLDCLYIELILQVSVNQCKGCCGCIVEGICYCLYVEVDFQVWFEFIDLEIWCFSLVGVILCMLQLGLGCIEEFLFLEVLDECVVVDGWQQLIELGVIDVEWCMIIIGKQMVCLLVDVKLVCMLVVVQVVGCLWLMLVIVLFLGIQDLCECLLEVCGVVDSVYVQFVDGCFEFVGVLCLWDVYWQVYEDLIQFKLCDWCGCYFFGFLCMCEW